MPEYTLDNGSFIFNGGDVNMVIKSPRLDRVGRLWANVEILEPSGQGYLGADQGDLGSERFRAQLAKSVAHRTTGDSHQIGRLLLDAYLALRADPAVNVTYPAPSFQPAPSFLNSLPAAQAPVVEGLLLEGGLYMLAARPKTGKSLALLNLALSVTLGSRWLGRRVTQGTALYFLLEDSPYTFRSRIRAMAPTGVTNDFRVHIGAFKLVEDNYLATVSSCDGATIIIVDPVIQTTEIKDWNSATDVRDGLELWRRLARDTGAAVILSAHHRKAEGDHGDQISGSTQALATVDGVIEFNRDRVRLGHTQRKVSFIGRDWPEMPDEVIDLEADRLTWRPQGSLDEVVATNQEGRRQTVMDCLPSESPGISRKQIRENTGLPEKMIAEILVSLDAQIGTEVRTGKGGGSLYYKLAAP